MSRAAMFRPLDPEELTALRDVKPKGEKRSTRLPLVPVPASAPPAEVYHHPELGKPTRLWRYETPDGLVGYIARWDTASPSGELHKEIRPLTFCQDENGRTGWAAIGFPEPRPLYNLVRLLARPDAPVLVVEGEKAADAAAHLFPDFVSTTAPHGALSPTKADWVPLHGRHVVISPDADKAGETYAEEVRRLARQVGAATVRTLQPGTLASREIREGRILESSRPVPKGWDLADAVAEGWTAALVHELSTTTELFDSAEANSSPRAGEMKKPHQRSSRRGRTRGPATFEVSEKGVYKKKLSGGDVEWIWICSRLDIIARTRNAAGEEHGRLLRWEDPDGQRREWAMPSRLLSGDGTAIREHLLSLGLEIAPSLFAKQALNEYLITSRPDATARCVGRIGWHQVAGALVFVLPDGTVHGDCGPERIVYQTSSIRSHRFDVAGSLEEWRDNIGKKCAGNSRLVLAVSTALAGPLLYLIGAESGGVHIYGQSSRGKTTVLAVAGSVWGGGGIRGFVQSWRATDNGLEGDAAAHCDTLLCLDELSECDPRSAANAAYMLSNGRGKSRADRSGDGRPRGEWRLLYLSTGEATLSERLAEDRNAPRARAGQDIRLLNVPADSGAGLGAFETLHGSTSAAAFADALKEASHRFYGLPGRMLVGWLASHAEAARETVRGFCKEFMQEHCPPGVDGQVYRAAQRFALIAAAGELAASIGILGWHEGEARQAVAACLNDWLAARGTPGAAEDAVALSKVRRFFENHGEARFTPWEGDPPDRPTINRAGFRRHGAGDKTEWLVLPEVWKTEVCAGLDPSRVARLGIAAGWLLPDSAGKPQSSLRLPGLGTKRVYLVTDAVLLEEDRNA